MAAEALQRARELSGPGAAPRAQRAYAALPVFAQNLACTWAGFRRARSRHGRLFRRHLGELERSSTASVAELRSIQRTRLDALVERARARTRFYRELPPPSTTADPDDAIAETLASIPILEKESVRVDPASLRCDDGDPNELLQGQTSGTTGSALPLWYDRDALAFEYAVVWRQRRALGARLGEPQLTFNGQLVVPFEQERPPFWRQNYWARQTLFSQHHMSEAFLPDYVDAIHRSPARWVQGYPSAIHLVAEAMLKAGCPLPEGRLVAVFTSSESLLAYQRDTIETAFGAPVRDRYGVSEFTVSMTECEAGRLHVDMEFGIVEVDTVEATDAYERGPLLVTGFANQAMPFLRYRIGDVGTRAKSPCPCNRPGETFLEIDGRLEDYVVTPEGRRVGRLDHIFKDQSAVAEAQLLQHTPERVEVRFVPRPTFDAAAEAALLGAIRLRLGERIAVDLRPVTAIEREANGKFRAVKSAVGGASGGVR